MKYQLKNFKVFKKYPILHLTISKKIQIKFKTNKNNDI